MMRRSFWLAVLIAGLFLPGSVHAQYGTQAFVVEDRPSAEGEPAHGSGSCSEGDRWLNWVTHPRNYCSSCGGSKPPIQTELYFRTGPSFIVGGGTYGQSLETGITFQGGAKAMFFNPPFDSAWYLDFSLSNSQNSASGNPRTVTLIVDDVATQATIRGLNRTFVSAGLGRAWYLVGTAQDEAPSLRWCLDGGGRWGTARGDFFEITHETDVIGGAYVGSQLDLEIPCRYCLFHVGLRLEYGYTWSDMLQRQSDVQDLNLLFQVGIRY